MFAGLLAPYNNSIYINAHSMGNALNKKVPLIYEKDLTYLNLGINCSYSFDSDSIIIDLSKFTDTDNLVSVCINTKSNSYYDHVIRDYDEWIETSNPIVTIERKRGAGTVNGKNYSYCAKYQMIKSIRIKST